MRAGDPLAAHAFSADLILGAPEVSVVICHGKRNVIWPNCSVHMIYIYEMVPIVLLCSLGSALSPFPSSSTGMRTSGRILGA